MSTAAAISANPRRLREYETIYILESNIDPDEADRIATRIKEIVSARTGHLIKIDNWGKRKLAYPIRKSSRGVFVFLKYLGFEDLVSEIERNLRLLDAVVRYQTVVIKPDVTFEQYQVDPGDLEFRRLEATEEAEEELASPSASAWWMHRVRRVTKATATTAWTMNTAARPMSRASLLMQTTRRTHELLIRL